MKRSILLATAAAFSFAIFGHRGVPSAPPPVPSPPLRITFIKGCGLAEGRQQVYDAATGTFHIHFRPGRESPPCGFEVTPVVGNVEKPIVFRLTGVPSWYGLMGSPLALSVGDTRYLIDQECWYYHDKGICDRTLFRVEREAEVVTVKFTLKGQALLNRGAQISFFWHHDW